MPRTLEEVANPNFRDALADRAVDYDALERRDQVFAFVQAYRSLNRGQDPALSPHDAYYLGWPDSLSVWWPGGPVAVPGRYRNERSGDVYNYVEGYGYRRSPAITAQSNVARSEAIRSYDTPSSGDFRDYYGLPDAVSGTVSGTPNQVPDYTRRRAIPRRVDAVPVQPQMVRPERIEPVRVEPVHVEPVHVEPVRVVPENVSF